MKTNSGDGAQLRAAIKAELRRTEIRQEFAPYLRALRKLDAVMDAFSDAGMAAGDANDAVVGAFRRLPPGTDILEMHQSMQKYLGQARSLSDQGEQVIESAMDLAKRIVKTLNRPGPTGEEVEEGGRRNWKRGRRRRGTSRRKRRRGTSRRKRRRGTSRRV